MKKNQGILFTLAVMLSAVLLFSSGCVPENTPPPDNAPRVRVDDWNIRPGSQPENGGSFLPSVSAPSKNPLIASAPAPALPRSGSENIGLATGGAKDINNFRENIRNDYLPLSMDVTYEGLFYDYYFDTGQADKCLQLFCPSYSYAITRDPFSGEAEYYLSVGLNSGMKESDFQRKKLKLVIVLDISGSMKNPFNSYYYDQFGTEVQLTSEDANKDKIEIATESVVALLNHLTDDDRFGMVLFNNDAFLAKPLNLVGNTDMKAIKDHILEISASGGTNLDAGMRMATGMYDELTDVDASEYENRIIFLTDAMPNLGDTSETGLLGMTRGNADQGVYTTFIGIGVDFNTELIEYITKISGANYYSVHSAEQFEGRMDNEFEYMVTPLVFNLQLTLEADGWEIEKVYGSPEANEATGDLMKVNTLFPSKKEEGETRGGLIVLKLNKTEANSSLTLKVSYEDRNGNLDNSEAIVKLQREEPEFFGNSGIRKGILLSRYADLLKNWMIDEREHVHLSRPWEPRVTDEIGIIVPPITLGRWERQSLPLVVSEPYKELFSEFRDYFKQEMNNLNDDTLNQELVILDKLVNE
ncbi:VWA domain-containing protein [Chloroflexota bacterium]